MGSVAQLPRKVTFTDLQRLPEDGPRFELYDGEVWEMPSPWAEHQIAAINALEVLREYRRRAGGEALISPLDIVFSKFNVVQPDVVFFVAARAHLVTRRQAIRHRPDLTVEVLSDGTARNDLGRKLDMFARYGVPEFWILDTAAHRLQIRSLKGPAYVIAESAGDDTVVTSPILSDLTFPIARLFEGC